MSAVVAVDLGIKSRTPFHLAARGARVYVVPSTVSFADIEALKPDGVFFSNGPGDPSTADREIGVLRAVLDAGIPYFGICFGHQLFGRALGYGTYKLDYGHRGINQPVKDVATGRVEITAHNHGFAVDAPVGEPSVAPSSRAGTAASRSRTSGSTTASSRACAPWTSQPSPSSTTLRQQRVRMTASCSSTASFP